MSNTRPALAAAAVMLSISACGEFESAPSPPLSPPIEQREETDGKVLAAKDVPTPIQLVQGVAHLKPVGGSGVHGTVELTHTSAGVVVDGEIHGLAPGKHAVHVHVASDCSASAGTFSKPGECLDRPAPLSDRYEREDSTEDEEEPAYCLGDLGTVEPAPDGIARLEAMVPALTLEPGLPNSLPGNVMIVHQWVDDWARDPEAQPGPAVACAVIQPFQPMA